MKGLGSPRSPGSLNVLVDWTDKNNYAIDMSRPSYEVYLNNPQEHPEKHHILDMCLSVKPT